MGLIQNLVDTGASAYHAIQNMGPVTYTRTPARSENYDIPKILAALAKNETGGVPEVQRDSFSKPSGSKALGNDLGRFQVTEGELRDNAQKFLGHPVTSQQFVSDPDAQRAYMTRKVASLLDEHVPLAGVFALHSQGMSGSKDLGVVDQKIQDSNAYRNNYVSRAYQTYYGGKTPTAPPQPGQ